MNEERLPFAKGVGQRPVDRRWLAFGAVLTVIGATVFAWLAMGMAASSNTAQSPGRPDVDLTVADGDDEEAAGSPADRDEEDGSGDETFVASSPEVATAEPGAALTKRELTETLRDAGWPEQLEAKARAVAGCESGWNPTAIGHLDERGLFQVHPVHDWRFQRLFGEDADPFDPYQNSAVALDIWERFGWDPWSCGDAGQR